MTARNSSLRALGSVVAIALLVASCSSAVSSTRKPTATSIPLSASPVVETASHAATEAYRAYMAQAGQQLSADLSALANDAVANQGNVSADVSQAEHAYDEVRIQMTATSSGSLGGASSQLDALGSVTLNARSPSEDVSTYAEQASSLQVEASEIQVILSRIVLAPQDIAITAKQAAQWIAIQAPMLETDASAVLSWNDLVIMVEACATWVQSLAPLGALVAPTTMAQSLDDVDSLSALVQAGNTGNVRGVVSAADATVSSLGSLAGDLYGYGEGGAYQ